MTIGERLRKFRGIIGMTSSEMAALLDISQGSYSELETGKNLPSATTLIRLCNSTRIDIRWLLMGQRSTFMEYTVIDGGILSHILLEVQRDEKIHSTWPDDLIHGAAIVLKEASDVLAAGQDYKYGDRSQGLRDKIETELIQTAATAIRMLKEMRG